MIKGTVDTDIKVESDENMKIKILQVEGLDETLKNIDENIINVVVDTKEELKEIKSKTSALNDYLVDLENDYYLNKTDIFNDIEELKKAVKENSEETEKISKEVRYYSSFVLILAFGFAILSVVK